MSNSLKSIERVCSFFNLVQKTNKIIQNVNLILKNNDNLMFT